MPPRPTLARCLLQSCRTQNPLTRLRSVPLTRLSRCPVPRRHYAFDPRRPQYNRFQQASALWKISPAFRGAVIIVGGGITVWIGSNIERAPVTGRLRFNCVSEEYEAELGRMGYQEAMQDHRDEILSPRDPRHVMVGRVLARLLPASGLKGDWEYHIIDDDSEINAFVIPG
ncbi:MAG: hypothetical protein LQ346_004222 [Caloplaca aetnensis]|nr:MAG: hypothetical protein LQ346_004222 [Caloplaca aetnensis]